MKQKNEPSPKWTILFLKHGGWIWRRKEVMFRIKVCRTECKAPSGSYVVNIRKSGGYHKDNKRKSPFDQSMCDVVFVDSPDGQYLIPSEKITQARAISLSQFKEYRLPS